MRKPASTTSFSRQFGFLPLQQMMRLSPSFQAWGLIGRRRGFPRKGVTLRRRGTYFEAQEKEAILWTLMQGRGEDDEKICSPVLISGFISWTGNARMRADGSPDAGKYGELSWDNFI
jgi:hypothetical protein